jgi:very-short-patch-repair endonuclease
MTWTYTPQNGDRTSKRRVAGLAGRQFGRVTWAQLQALGLSTGTITRWHASGYLIQVLPRVYAVGHHAADIDAWLFSLVLFAGPDAALSHGTAAYRRGWLRYPVSATHISTPRRIRAAIPGVAFHCRRELDREPVDGVPCTAVTQTLFDLATSETRKLVSRALAQLDFERALDADALRATFGSGHRGTANLRAALDAYIPQLARTKSELEDEFLHLCQRFNIPLPEINVMLHGKEVDCYWRDAGLVVELDGQGNHGTASQRNRDERHSLSLRANGLTVLRYTWAQVMNEPDAVAADLSSVGAWTPRPLSTI